MLDKFIENLNEVSLYNKTIILGVSTGVDSMVMLDLFMKVKDKYNLKIVISHINHKKRLQSEEEEAFIKDYALKNNLDISCEVYTGDGKNNFQSDARNFRYQVYVNLCDKYSTDVFALAHHGCDEVETILMRTLRGSSLNGYSGMHKKSMYKSKIILRPLLTFTKDEIYDYALKNNLKFYEDESNKSNVYTRNRLRSGVVKEIFKENPDAHIKFLEFSDCLSKASNFINGQRDEFIQRNVKKDVKKLTFSLSAFKNIDPYLQEEVLFELLKQYSLSKKTIEEILKIIYSDKPNILTDFKNTFSVAKEYDQFSIFNGLFRKDEVDIIIDGCGKYKINDILNLNVIKKDSIPLTKVKKLCYNTDYIYLDPNEFPLRLRNRLDGDKIKLSKGSKKVKDVLIDEKISITSRENALVLLNKDNEVLWICGVKKSDSLKEMKGFEIKIIFEGNNNNA